ncbi:MAG TPA: condensation domain-containing protein, partial [Blastocatellia bacterium]|nr:condensation domain-containing protein [Blastocatellia bacterium]
MISENGGTSLAAAEEAHSQRIHELEDSFVMSPMQEGMLFQSLYSPYPDMYIRQVVATLEEELNIPALSQAWSRVMARHQVLRAGVRWDYNAEPAMEVYRKVDLPFAVLDWREVPLLQQARAVEEFAAADRRKSFDLSRAPLLRVTLIRIGESDYRLVWTHHHMISDGYSDPFVLTEVFRFYDLFRQGGSAEIEEARTYKEQCLWLRRLDLAKAEDFWRNVLEGFTGSPALVIGRDGHRGNEHPEHRGEQRLSLPEDLTSALNAFSQRNHLTLNSMFQGVWGLLLSRYTGEDDVVFGALRACRRSALDGRGGLGIAGPFINTVPVRLRIRRSESVVSWLKGVRE